MTGNLKVFWLFLVFGLSSCGIYRQNMVNAPLMQHKGQAQISGSTSFTGKNAQIGYAATKNIAVIANYSNLGTKRNDYSIINYSIEKHKFYEVGAGFYRKNRSELINEYFLIAGRGFTSRFVQGLDSARRVTTYSRKASYKRFCLQADFGKIENNWEWVASPRILVVNYYNVEDTSLDLYKDLPNTYLYTEVAGTIRYNFLKYFKISGQISTTLPVTGYNVAYYEFSPFNCSLGLMVNLNFIKQPK